MSLGDRLPSKWAREGGAYVLNPDPQRIEMLEQTVNALVGMLKDLLPLAAASLEPDAAPPDAIVRARKFLNRIAPRERA